MNFCPFFAADRNIFPFSFGMEKFHPDSVRQVGRDQDTPAVKSVVRIQLLPGTAFNQGARLLHIGDFDADADDLSIVVI